MLIIKSFLKKPQRDIYNLEEVTRNPYDFFIDIDNTAAIQELVKQFDEAYLEGALIIKYNERTILDFTYYDLIDDLLAYFLNMLDELQTKDVSHCSFPDMPTEIKIKRINKNMFNISFEGGEKVAFKVPEYEFVRALLDEAHHFFTVAQPVLHFPKSHYLYQLNQIKNLRKIYAHDA